MSHRLTITLDSEAYRFLQEKGGNNRSQFINTLLKKVKQRVLEDELKRACLEEAQDKAYTGELNDWEATLGDGIESL